MVGWRCASIDRVRIIHQAVLYFLHNERDNEHDQSCDVCPTVDKNDVLTVELKLNFIDCYTDIIEKNAGTYKKDVPLNKKMLQRM